MALYPPSAPSPWHVNVRGPQTLRAPAQTDRHAFWYILAHKKLRCIPHPEHGDCQSDFLTRWWECKGRYMPMHSAVQKR